MTRHGFGPPSADGSYTRTTSDGAPAGDYKVTAELWMATGRGDDGPKSQVRQDAVSTVRVRWVTYLLPYLEQENLYRAVNLGVNWYQQANLPAFGSRLKLLECPSAPNGGVIAGAPDTAPA